MSDFPSSKCPPIPWRDAVQRVPLGSTMAPGPPTAQPASGKRKIPRAVAASLRGLVPPDDDRSYPNGSDEVGDGWDPMAQDYDSPEFNAYNSGSGALMQAAKKGGGGDGMGQEEGNINLFVTNIPTALTKNAFRELFSRAGVVRKVSIVKPNQPSKQTTYGFAEFATIKEADTAIQMFHNFDMGNDIKLGVKVSETKESREKRLSEKTKNDEFLSTLNCGKYTTSEEVTSAANGYELTAQEMKLCEKNPFLPTYTSRKPVADSHQELCISQEDGEEEGEVAKGFSLGSSAGASSLQAAALHSPTHPPSAPAAQPTPGTCRKCGTECKMKCQKCKTPYCSETCQASDWGRHKFECKKISAGMAVPPRPSQRAPSSVVIHEREDSEGEGFDIPTPPLEEFMGLLEKPQESTVSKAVQRLSSEKTASILPASEDKKVEGASARVSSRPPLSLPIVGSSDAKQTYKEMLTPPHSPPQSPITHQERMASTATQPSPANVSFGNSLSPTEILEVFQSAKFPLPSIPLGCEPPQKFHAVVTSALSCSRFSAILMSVESKQALKAIQECSTTLRLSPVEPFCLVVGSKVGYIDQHGSLLRMEVTKLFPRADSIELRYYDVGGFFKTSFAQPDLVTLPENIVTIPCLRYRCDLNAVQRAKDYVGVDYLMGILQDTAVRVTNLGKFHNLSHSIFYRCDVHFLDGRSIGPLVSKFLSSSPRISLSANTAQPWPSLSSPSGPPLLEAPSPSRLPPPATHQPGTPTRGGPYRLMHMARDVQVHMLAEKTFVIIPRVVDSPSSIWAHVKHPRLSYLHQMQEDLNHAYGSGSGDPYSPSIGELCVVRYCQDGLFYRAEVLCVNNNGTVDVRFVDYGRREMILASQVRHIEPVYLSLLIQALHFSMEGVVPVGHTLNWGDNVITYLKDKILNREINATLIQTKSHVHHISLCDPDDSTRSLAVDMTSKGLCEKASGKTTNSSPSKMPGVKTLQCTVSWDEEDPSKCPPLLPHPSPPHPPPPEDLHTPDKKTARSKELSPVSPHTPPACSPYSRSHGEGETAKPPERSVCDSPGKGHRGELLVPQISLSLESEVTVLVTTVVSPVQFHVHRFEKAALMTLMDITQKLNQMQLQPLSRPRTNMYCVAKYAEDDTLYRSRIFKCSDSMCTVKFIDYGNLEDVPVSDIYVLPDEFTSLPAQGILCTLWYFKQVGAQEQEGRTPPPTPRSIEYFKSLVEEKQLKLRVRMVLDTNPYLYPKHVVEITTEKGEDVLSAMVECGYSEVKGSPRKQKSGGGGGGGGKQGGFKKWGGEGKGKRGGRGGKEEGGFKRGVVEGGFRRGKEEGGGFNQRVFNQREEEKQSAPVKPWGTQPAAVQKNPSLNSAAGVEKTPLEKPAQSSDDSGSQPLTAPSLTSSGATLLSSLPVTQLPSDKEYVEVVVTDVSDPHTLHLQLATERSLQSISSLQTDLNSLNLPPSSSPSSLLVEGELCCCKYPEDDMWYRATVIEKLRNECVVRFIDYGNTETVPFGNIIPCPAQFLSRSVMAVRCSLFGVFPPPPSPQWPPQAIALLKQRCYDRVLLAKIGSRDLISNVPSVQLFDTSGDTDISMSAELIGAGLAVSTPPQAPPTASDPAPTPKPEPSASAQPPPTTHLSAQPPPTTHLTAQPPTTTHLSSNVPDQQPVSHLPGPVLPEAEEFDVLVMSVNSFIDLYIHPVTKDTQQVVETYMNSITEYCSSQTTPPATPPSVGHYCLAQFTDGSWFRAKVKSVNFARGTLDVFFVDFGNNETVTLSQIRQMPAQFTDLPIQSLQCSLYGIEPRAALEPDPAACSLFGEITTSSKMTCRVITHRPLLVDLTSPTTGRSAREQLSAAGKLPPLSPNAVFSIQSCTLPPAARSKVLVTETRGPGAFWVQCADSTDLPKLPPLMHAIGVHCSQPLSPSHTPVLGELCCAKFSEDEVWYRARVVAFPSLTQCRVRFLDYGNCENCAMSEVLPLTEKFLTLPALAIPCTLQGWEDSSGEEEGEGEGGVVSKFKGLVENKILQVELRSCKRGRGVVEMTSPDGPIQKLL